MTTATIKTYCWCFWTLAILGFCLDQGSKYWAFSSLAQVPPNWVKDGDQEIEIVPGVFYFAVNYTDVADPGDSWRTPLRTISSSKLPKVNHGALWGFGGRDETGNDYNHIFALVSVAAALLMMGWSLREATATDRWLCIALGLILAGTLGNLYDRIVFDGVRDFLQWVYLYNWPRFNIADSCLVCGAGLLLVQAFFASPVEEKPTTTAKVNTASIPASHADMPMPLPETADA